MALLIKETYLILFYSHLLHKHLKNCICFFQFVSPKNRVKNKMLTICSKIKLTIVVQYNEAIRTIANQLIFLRKYFTPMKTQIKPKSINKKKLSEQKKKQRQQFFVHKNFLEGGNWLILVWFAFWYAGNLFVKKKNWFKLT